MYEAQHGSWRQLDNVIKKHEDWFDHNNGAIRELLRAKKWGACCKATQSTLGRLTRQVEGSPIYNTEGTASHENPSDSTICWQKWVLRSHKGSLWSHSIHPVNSKDGSTIIKDQQGILDRWAEHLSELLNCINPHDPTFLDLLPQFPSIPDLNVTPSQCVGSKTTKLPAQTIYLPKLWSTAVILCCTNSTALLCVRGTHGSSHKSRKTLTSSQFTNAKGILLIVVIAVADKQRHFSTVGCW